MKETTVKTKTQKTNTDVIEELKVKIFDKLRDLEKLQAYANKLNEEKSQLVKQLEAAENISE